MGEPVIYFLELVGTGKVKIGKSKCLGNRLRQYRLHYDPSQELRLLKTIAGYTAEEMVIHARFAEHCVDATVSREWFWLEPIREQIMEMEGVDASLVRTGRGKAARVVVVSDVCGHEKETSHRHQAEARRSACQKCCGKLHWETLSDEDRKAQVEAWGRRGQDKGGRTRSLNSLKRWEEERLPKARANAVCIECGAALNVLSRRKYYKLPDGVDTKRMCLSCGVSRGMTLVWKRPEYQQKMSLRRITGRRGAGMAHSEGAGRLSVAAKPRRLIRERVGVSDKTAGEWISGRSVPDIEHRKKILEAFGIPLDAWERLTSETDVRPSSIDYVQMGEGGRCTT